MESPKNELKMEDLELFPYKSEQKINIYKSYPQSKFNPSKFKKNFNGNNKYYYNANQRFLKYKRKNKKIKNEMPETPHNTGQYLSHIHQEQESKRKSSQDKNDDEFALNGISCFNDDIDDIDDLGDFDFDFINDKKRERIMSMEGKEFQDFLFKPRENEEDENNKLAKSDQNLEEIKEEYNLDLKNNRSSNL